MGNKEDKEVTTSLIKEVEGKAMREFCPRKQGGSRGLRPDLLILNKGATTSLSLSKPFSSNRVFILRDTCSDSIAKLFRACFERS